MDWLQWLCKPLACTEDQHLHKVIAWTCPDLSQCNALVLSIIRAACELNIRPGLVLGAIVAGALALALFIGEGVQQLLR
jgi:hypothetical protein